MNGKVRKTTARKGATRRRWTAHREWRDTLPNGSRFASSVHHILLIVLGKQGEPHSWSLRQRFNLICSPLATHRVHSLRTSRPVPSHSHTIYNVTLVFPLSLLVISLVRSPTSWERQGGGATTSCQRTGTGVCRVLRHALERSYVINK